MEENSYKNSETAPPIMQGAPPPIEQRLPFIDWDRPPWNRWSFQRVSEFLPTALIRKGKVVSPLQYSLVDISDIEVKGPSGEVSNINQFIEDTYTDGFLIMHNGKVIHETYYNGMDERTLHLCQSVSKSICATAGASLIEEGLLDPNELVTNYLPELSQTGWKGATIQHVLDMTSGVKFVETYEDRECDIGKMDFASGWKPAPEGVDVSKWPKNIWDQILSLSVKEVEHGERHEYRSIETDIFAHAMERVTGKRLPQIVSERLWAPMGAEEDANITVDSNGYGLACGGVSASLRDLARFADVMLNEGMSSGKQVVPISWIKDVRHGKHGMRIKQYFDHGIYRNQFWVEDSEIGSHYCLGVFGQLIYVNPQSNMVAVKLSTFPTFRDELFTKYTMRALQEIAKQLN